MRPTAMIAAIALAACGGDLRAVPAARDARVAPMASSKRIHAIVTGLVQGVAYRASTAAEAQRLGLTGWVRNLPDGSVELEAEGPPDAVAALATWCHRGPPAARVEHVAIDERAPTGADRDFAIRR